MDLKNNQGVLFKNEKTKDTHPDFTGELNVDGKTMRIALWKKTSSKGTVYLSVQVSGSEEKHKEENKEPQTVGDILDDAIPF